MDRDAHYAREDWQRLGDALAARRGQLGFGFRRRAEFSRDSGLSDKTIGRYEKGLSPSTTIPPSTAALLEHLYQWEPGSVGAVLSGGDPVPLPGTAGAPQPVSRRRFDDPDLQVIWDTDLPDHVKLGAVAGARAAKEAAGNPSVSAFPALRRADEDAGA